MKKREEEGEEKQDQNWIPVHRWGGGGLFPEALCLIQLHLMHTHAPLGGWGGAQVEGEGRQPDNPGKWMGGWLSGDGFYFCLFKGKRLMVSIGKRS